MYKILIKRKALDDLNALEESLQKRITERILLLKANPRLGAKKLISLEFWRIRIGNWRVIYEINDDRKEIEIFRIKHRSKAY